MSISNNDTAIRLVTALMLTSLQNASSVPATQNASSLLAPSKATPLTSFNASSLLGTVPVNTLQAAGKTSNIDKTTVMLFDSKNPPPDNFDHIGEMTKEITTNAGAGITVKPVDIGFGADKLSNLETGLNTLIADNQAGRPVPGVINLSMIATGNDAQVQRLKQSIQTLADSGVKFTISVPPTGVNTLIPAGSHPNIIPVSNVAGTPNATTGNGRTPSFATANTAGNLIKQLSQEPTTVAPTAATEPSLLTPTTPTGVASNQSEDPVSMLMQLCLKFIASKLGLNL